LKEAVCGNAKKEGSEACDDGNKANGDGCSSTCTIEPKCGNKVLESGEQCDDGNVVNGDGCSSICKSEPRCGNAVLEPGEQCDDGNLVSGDGCEPDCNLPDQPSVCGNNLREGNEACDDGNTTSGDGCSSTCQVEPRCGDGRLDETEDCDDGNIVNGDGCSATCKREPPGKTCKECVDAKCRRNADYGDLDLFAGCYERIDINLGADAGDPTFLQDCIDLVSCAYTNNCAYDFNGMAACYCGSASSDDCINVGPAADAKCAAQVRKAARATTPNDVAIRMTDLAYPSGWAYFLLECQTTNCNNSGVGKCTP